MKKFFAVAVLVSALASAQEHNHPPITLDPTVTTMDVIPDFAKVPTISSAKSGPCQEPSTWVENRQPTATDIVDIKNGHTVYGSCNAKVVGVHGRYVCDAGVYTVGTTIVYREGAWTAANKCEYVFRDVPIDPIADPKQFGTGFIAFGEVNLQGNPKTSHVRLSGPIAAGDISINLERAPEGWRPGDRVVIPDTRQVPISYKVSTSPDIPVVMQTEERIIASVNGSTVVFTEPLAFAHLAGIDKDGKVIGLPHAANLTRSIVVRSENPNGTRGHFLVTERAVVNIKHVQFLSLGRTTEAPLSPLTNPIGRYGCVHLHHLMGPRNLMNVGYQFVVQGIVCEDGRKGGIAIHNSHYGLITDNVVYRHAGFGIMAEQGNERGNEIRRNIVLSTGAPITSWYNPTYGGVRTQTGTWIDFAWEGSAFWMAGNDHILTDNVAANSKFADFMFNARAASNFANHHPKVPNFRGAEIAWPEEWTDYNAAIPKIPAPGVIEVRGNEGYASAVGVWVAFAGGFGTMYDTKLWNIRQSGAYVARNGWANFENLIVVNDPVASAANYNPNRGLDSTARTYTSGGLSYKNVVVTGWNIGVSLPGNTTLQAASLWPNVSPEIVIDGLTAKNNINIMDASPHRDKSTVIKLAAPLERYPWGKTRPVSVTPEVTPPMPMDIVDTLEPATVDANIIKKSTLVIYQPDGVPYEYFFPAQAPNRVMPERIYPTGVRAVLQNCPSVGLTNEQCWTAHGVATLGRVATCTMTKPEVRGFVCPVK